MIFKKKKIINILISIHAYVKLVKSNNYFNIKLIIIFKHVYIWEFIKTFHKTCSNKKSIPERIILHATWTKKKLFTVNSKKNNATSKEVLRTRILNKNKDNYLKIKKALDF